MTARTEAPATEEELARAGARWFADVEELSKSDPAAADRLLSAMWRHLSAVRPETPCSLSESIEPTEEVPTEAPGGDG